ncbi:MAG TPA: D-aminoacylase [Gemmatimonadales bacterium]|nr:D-aminoacylase [Gemmatimonadales bacterium]
MRAPLALGGACLLAALSLASTRSPGLLGRRAPDYDVLLVRGTVVDGTGAPRRRADVAVSGDRIAAIGNLSGRTASRTVDVSGLVVAPGFIDMLGHSEATILVDPRGVSKVTQGVTTEITGEGSSIAPVDAATLREDSAQYAAWDLVVDWHDLDGYFRRLERSGTPLNIATFVGATQVRRYVLGDADRAPTAAELAEMEALADTAMRQGALGVSSALVYAPAFYAKTAELIALAKVAAKYGGVYATHIRNEGSRIDEALAEAFRIGREARVPVEVWHLKVAGRASWGRMPRILARFDRLRAAGQRVGANSYPYTASATSLDASIPAWAHAGGVDSMLARLRNPATRARIRREMGGGTRQESFSGGAGGLSGVMVLGVLDSTLKRYEGRRITEIARDEHRDPYDVLFDILLADHARTGAAYFSMSEADVRAAVAAPWIGVGMDFGAVAPDGPLHMRVVHPRAYGTFPRILGRYVREEHALTLEAAVRKMTGVAAERLGLKRRGILREGNFADITVFDPTMVADRATFQDPHQPSVGIRYVLVNGRFTLDGGHLTGERPGRALRGPGWQGP